MTSKSLVSSESLKDIVLSPKVIKWLQLLINVHCIIMCNLCLCFQEKMQQTISDIVSKVSQCLITFDSPLESKVCVAIIIIDNWTIV